MVMSTHESGYGYSFGLGSGFGVEPIDERICEFVSSEITCGILDETPIMFGTITEGIMEMQDERLRAFRV